MFLGCDHFAVCMTTSCCDFEFLVAIVLVVFLPSSVSILCRDIFCFPFLFFCLQPQFYVATHFLQLTYFSGHNLKLVSQPQFLLLSSSSGCDLIEWSRHRSDVTTSFVQCSFSVDVATSVTCRDIIVFLFFQLLSCDMCF